MDEQGQAPLQPDWKTRLDPREQAQIAHAVHYAANFSHSGAPGHGQFLLIAKLTRMLDGTAPPKTLPVVWDETSKSWRDVQTGVKVEVR